MRPFEAAALCTLYRTRYLFGPRGGRGRREKREAENSGVLSQRHKASPLWGGARRGRGHQRDRGGGGAARAQ